MANCRSVRWGKRPPAGGQLIAQETVHYPVERTHLPENLEPAVERN